MRKFLSLFVAVILIFTCTYPATAATKDTAIQVNKAWTSYGWGYSIAQQSLPEHLFTEYLIDYTLVGKGFDIVFQDSYYSYLEFFDDHDKLKKHAAEQVTDKATEYLLQKYIKEEKKITLDEESLTKFIKNSSSNIDTTHIQKELTNIRAKKTKITNSMKVVKSLKFAGKFSEAIDVIRKVTDYDKDRDDTVMKMLRLAFKEHNYLENITTIEIPNSESNFYFDHSIRLTAYDIEKIIDAYSEYIGEVRHNKVNPLMFGASMPEDSKPEDYGAAFAYFVQTKWTSIAEYQAELDEILQLIQEIVTLELEIAEKGEELIKTAHKLNATAKTASDAKLIYNFLIENEDYFFKWTIEEAKDPLRVTWEKANEYKEAADNVDDINKRKAILRKALDKIDSHIYMNPSAEAYDLKSKILVGLGEIKEARIANERSIEIDPSPKYLKQKAHLANSCTEQTNLAKQMLKQYPNAINEYNEILSLVSFSYNEKLCVEEPLEITGKLTENWSVKMAPTMFSPRVQRIDGDTLYTVTSPAYIEKYSISEAKRLGDKNYSNLNLPDLASITDKEGNIYVGGYKKIIKYDSDFNLIKEISTTSDPSLALGKNGYIYALLPDGHLYRLDENLQIKASFEFEDPVITTPITIGPDNTLYFGNSHTLYAIKEDLSEEKWAPIDLTAYESKYRTISRMTQPVVSDDNIVYTTSGDTLMAIKDGEVIKTIHRNNSPTDLIAYGNVSLDAAGNVYVSYTPSKGYRKLEIYTAGLRYLTNRYSFQAQGDSTYYNLSKVFITDEDKLIFQEKGKEDDTLYLLDTSKDRLQAYNAFDIDTKFLVNDQHEIYVGTNKKLVRLFEEKEEKAVITSASAYPKTISGDATPYANIVIKADGKVIGKTTSYADGRFNASYKEQKPGTQLQLFIEGDNDSPFAVNVLDYDENHPKPALEVTIMKNKVESNKKWKITFNQQINAQTLTNQSVYVTDENLNPLDVNVQIDETGKKLEIYPPKEGYISGKTYSIFITDALKSIKNKNLVQSKKYDFTIK